MDYDKTNLGWIAAAAALAGGVAYYLSDQGMRVRRTYDNELALERTRELARVSPEKLVTGAAVTVVLAGVALWGYRSKDRVGSGMQEVEETIDIDVPVSTAYNQWTQFEEFPRFMPTVESVKQIDDSHLHWKAVVAGKVKEWDSEITQQIPDQMIEWKSTSGPRNGGVVTFDKIKENKTRVKLRLWYTPESSAEKIGGLFGGVKMTAKGNLKRFAQLLERRGMESGAWRGEIAPASAH
ncbi:MAG TPA: SRPBCC family protein [Ramlibacter sp.]|nr:SRPBCC family protein [Ramlibacter sp.]